MQKCDTATTTIRVVEVQWIEKRANANKTEYEKTSRTDEKREISANAKENRRQQIKNKKIENLENFNKCLESQTFFGVGQGWAGFGFFQNSKVYEIWVGNWVINRTFYE